MKKLTIFFAVFLLIGMGYAQKSNPKSPKKGMVSVTLEAHNTYGNGVGYQLLLDPTATMVATYNLGFGPSCNLIPAGLYDCPYKIPANADPDCATSNMVMDGAVTIQIPAGTYDYYVLSPDFTTSNLYTAYVGGEAHAYEFEDGKSYLLLVEKDASSGFEKVTVIVADALPEGTPAKVSDLAFTPGASGTLTADLSWKNPSLTAQGAALTELTAVKIYENDEENAVHTISNPEIGGTVNYPATVAASGFYTYTIVAENSVGSASATTEELWVGLDVPQAPTNVVLVKSNDEANVTWEAPTAGLHDAYFSSTGLVYDVYRMPAEVRVSENQAGLSFSESVPVQGAISYKIVAKNSSGEGGSATSNAESYCNMIVSSFPWAEGFDGTTIEASCWRVIDGDLNATNIKWDLTSDNPISMVQGHTGRGVIHSYSTNLAEEGWLISPRIVIPETGVYGLSFWSRSTNPGNPAYHGVWISTTDDNPSSFTELHALSAAEITLDWTNLEQSLSAFAGDTIYLAFKYLSSGNQDNWVLDDIRVEEKQDIDAVALKLFGAPTPMVGKPFTYKVMIKNEGANPLSDYTLKLIGNDVHELVTGVSGAAIAANETRQIEFTWTPANTDDTTLYVVVEANNDNNATNNQTPKMPIRVQATDEVYAGTVGTDTLHANNFQLPFNFYYKNGIAQTLYFDHELAGKQGAVFELQYFNNFTENVSGKPIQIWMANTNLNQLETLLPQSEFALVYDGTMDFPTGENTITITLDEPFIYTGENLVIMTHRMMDENYYDVENTFHFTEDVDFPKRSLYYQSNTEAFDWTQEGTGSNYYPNTIVKMKLDGGSVSGTVTSSSNPVEGVLVQRDDSYEKRTTDADGKFSFDFVLPGEHQFAASKYGYWDTVSEEITVSADANTVANITINSILKRTISGTVYNVDKTRELSDAKITFSGYDTVYRATSDADGEFTIANVYDKTTYQVEVILPGYVTYRGTFDVDGNMNFEPMLSEVAYPVKNATAVESGENVTVSWDLPVAEHRLILDDGTVELGYFGTSGNEVWFGNKFTVEDAGELTGVDVFGFEFGSFASGKTLTVDIFDETRTIIGTSVPFILPGQAWISIPLDNIPYAAGEFYAMVHWTTATGSTHYLGMDTDGPHAAENLDMIRQTNGTWGLIHELGGEKPGVFMVRVNTVPPTSKKIAAKANNEVRIPVKNTLIRAEGVAFTVLPQAIDAEKARHSVLDTESPKTHTHAYEEIAGQARNDDRSFSTFETNLRKFTPAPASYKVYRLAEDAPESAWVEVGTSTTASYTDTTWYRANSGVYQYAVKAVYAGTDNVSEAQLTNIIGKKMNLVYTVNVSTNSGDVASDAMVVLTNQDEDTNHVYVKNTNAEGKVVFPSVWKGEYDLLVIKEGFQIYSEKDLNLITGADSLSHSGVQLTEDIKEIFEVEVEVEGANARLSWNNTPPGLETFEDGFENLNFDAWDEFIKGDGIVGVSGDSAFWYIVPANTYAAGKYEGNYIAFVDYGSNVNTWLISPEIGIKYGTKLSFAFSTNYIFHVAPRDSGDLWVKISTDNGETWNSIWRENDYGHFSSYVWCPVTLDLSEYVGQSVKIAFNMTGNNGDIMALDGVKVSTPPTSKSFSGYTVYLDDVEKATGITATEYLFENLEDGDYVAGVKAVYTSGNSALKTVPFKITESDIQDMMSTKELYAYSVKNEIFIVNPNNIRLQAVQVFDITGQLVHETKLTSSTSFTLNVPTGHYFVRLIPEAGKPSVAKVYLTK